MYSRCSYTVKRQSRARCFRSSVACIAIFFIGTGGGHDLTVEVWVGTELTITPPHCRRGVVGPEPCLKSHAHCGLIETAPWDAQNPLKFS
jgi:hypothetical protein